MEELDAAIEEARRDDAVKALLVRSANEKFFSAGADISVFASSGLEEKNAFVAYANEAMSKLESTAKVVVAAINGHCLGGGLEMALCCDFRVAAEGGYRIGLPEVTLGLLPGTGGTQRLPRLIGRQKALDLMLTGRTLVPQEALGTGIVDAVVPAGELVEKSLALLRPYATGPTFAIGRIKKAAVLGSGMTLADGLKLEREMLIELFRSEDAKEGVTAFVEKRKPNYKGK